jgi:hypothetical protein
MPSNVFSDYFRCPDEVANAIVPNGSFGQPGFFQFGKDICYGTCACPTEPKLDGNELCDALGSTHAGEGRVSVPFNPSEVINNLRLERYVPSRTTFPNRLTQRAYYTIRRVIPEQLRWRLQRHAYFGWEGVRFPHWPVDTTVESILQTLWTLLLQASGAPKLPFVWFWPDGYSGAACMTHDVDTAAGLEFCPALMEIDATFGVKSSFQLVPEERYKVSERICDEMRQRGFEVNIHDLNHDGRLFTGGRRVFLKRAKAINSYGHKFGAQGFRSGMMYRNQGWYDGLQFSYDMSVPNVAHLEPQQGGCCTVMPYFAGEMLVLPLTTTQDFALFQILGEHSTDLWERQLCAILQKNGLATFIVHPDYLRSRTDQRVYKQLLSQVSVLHSEGVLWVASPGEVNRWWRQRSSMRLVQNAGEWRVVGAGSERARVAYASLDHGRLSYEVAGPSAPNDCDPVVSIRTDLTSPLTAWKQ